MGTGHADFDHRTIDLVMREVYIMPPAGERADAMRRHGVRHALWGALNALSLGASEREVLEDCLATARRELAAAEGLEESDIESLMAQAARLVRATCRVARQRLSRGVEAAMMHA